MRNETVKKTAQMSKKRKRRILWQRVVSILAAITVFCTTYALILPAITMTTNAGDLDGGYTIVDTAQGNKTTVTTQVNKAYIEAEDWLFNGDGTQATDGKQYDTNSSGGYKVTDLGQDRYIEFIVDAPSADTYTMSVYAHGNGGTRDAAVWLNGNLIDDEINASGNTFTANNIDLDLQEGANVIKFAIANGSGNTVHFDYITIDGVSLVTGSTISDADTDVLTIEAEDVFNKNNGGAEVRTSDLEAGGDDPNGVTYVGGMDTTGYLEFEIYVPATADYTLTICNNTGDERKAYVDVDGVQSNTVVTCAGWGNWDKTSSFKNTEATIALTAGTHTIKIYNNVENMPNVDYVQFTSPEGVADISLGATYALEAESATIGGEAATVDNAEASNGKHVGDIGKNGTGYIEFTVYAVEAGTYPLDIYYIQDGNRQFVVTVTGSDGNAVVSDPIDCPSSGSWTAPAATPLTVNVELKAGVNTIRIGGNAAFAPNVDKLELDCPADAVFLSEAELNAWEEAQPKIYTYTTLFEAEDVSVNANITNTLASASGGVYASGFGANGGGDGYMEFTVDSETAQTATLIITYAQDADRDANISINGGAAQTIDLVDTDPAYPGVWTVFETKEIEVELVADENKIKIDSPNAMGHFDKFEIVTTGSTVASVYTEEEVITNDYTYSVEAEDYNSEGDTNASTASGGMVVSGLDNAAVGDDGMPTNKYIQFPVYVAEDGTYTMNMIYNSYDRRGVKIAVDGTALNGGNAYTTNNTGSWGKEGDASWAETSGTLSVSMTLSKGTHTITVFNNVGNVPTIDYFTLTGDSPLYADAMEAAKILSFDFDAEDFTINADGEDYISGTGRAEIGNIIPVASAAGVTYAVDDEGNTVAKFDGNGGIFWTPNQNEDSTKKYDENGVLKDGELSNDPAALLNLETAASTFSVWIKPEETTSYDVFAYGGANGTAHSETVHLLTRPFGAEVFYRNANASAGGENKQAVTYEVTANEWHLFNIVQVDADTVLIYIDGNLLATKNGIQAGHQLKEFIQNADNSYYLGTSPSADAAEAFIGYMDEFVLYDRALTADEIQFLYNQRHQIKIVQPTEVKGATVKLFNYDEFVNELAIATPTKTFNDILKTATKNGQKVDVYGVTVYNNDNFATTDMKTFNTGEQIYKGAEVDSSLLNSYKYHPGENQNYLFLKYMDDPSQDKRDDGTFQERVGFWETFRGFRFFHQSWPYMSKNNPYDNSVDGAGPFLDLVTSPNQGYGLGVIDGSAISNTLGSDGYPFLNAADEDSFTDDDGVTFTHKWQGGSLGAFFDETYNTRAETGTTEETNPYIVNTDFVSADGVKNEFYVTTMQNGGGLFQQKMDGYFEYDSQKNAAWYNPETNRFELYDHAVRPVYQNSSAGTDQNEECGNFYPFNRVLSDDTNAYVTCDVAEGETQAVAYQVDTTYGAYDGSNGDIYTDEGAARLQFTEASDNWFGMSVEFDFYMTPEGKVVGPDGYERDMIFDFFGDDDVYVYIDDTLVLNIGGIHGATGGTINFATGDVDSPGQKQDLNELFAGTDKLDATGTTLQPYKLYHLKFFYMERGGNISYCRLRFNMPIIEPNTLAVVKELEYDENTEKIYENGVTTDFKFRVVHPSTTNPTEPSDNSFFSAGTKFDIRENGMVYENAGTVQADGYFYLRAGQQAEFRNIEPGSTYIVQEILPDKYVEVNTGQYQAILYAGVNNSNDGEVYNALSPITVMPREDESVYSTPPITNNDGETHFIAFQNKVNMKNLNTLEISKDFAEDMSDKEKAQYADQSFQMYVEIGGKPVTVGTAYTVYSDSNSTGTVKNVETEGVIVLKAGEWAIIDKLLAGTEFKVTELDATGFKPMYYMGNHFATNPHGQEDEVDGAVVEASDPDVGTNMVDLGCTAYVHVENSTYAFNAEIPIEKQITNPDGSTDFFHFAVEEVDANGASKNNPLSGTVMKTGTNGYGASSIYIGYKSGVTSGTYYYKITENANYASTIGDYYFDDTVYYVEVNVNSYAETATVNTVWKNSISDNTKVNFNSGDLKLSFTNPRTVDLKIEKSVIGDTTTQAEQTYKFDVTFTDAIDPMLNLGTPDVAKIYTIGCAHAEGHDKPTIQFTLNGEAATDTFNGATFELAHGDSITIRVPYGVTATVTETQASGYTTEYQVNDGASLVGNKAENVKVDKDTTVKFINTVWYELPETGGIGTYAYIMSGLALLGAAGWLLYRKLRKAGEGVGSL